MDVTVYDLFPAIADTITAITTISEGNQLDLIESVAEALQYREREDTPIKFAIGRLLPVEMRELEQHAIPFILHRSFVTTDFVTVSFTTARYFEMACCTLYGEEVSDDDFGFVCRIDPVVVELISTHSRIYPEQSWVPGVYEFGSLQSMTGALELVDNLSYPRITERHVISYPMSVTDLTKLSVSGLDFYIHKQDRFHKDTVTVSFPTRFEYIKAARLLVGKENHCEYELFEVSRVSISRMLYEGRLHPLIVGEESDDGLFVNVYLPTADEYEAAKALSD
jgi:hypothetical protein